jgi:hypothetical protein
MKHRTEFPICSLLKKPAAPDKTAGAHPAGVLQEIIFREARCRKTGKLGLLERG